MPSSSANALMPGLSRVYVAGSVPLMAANATVRVLISVVYPICDAFLNW